MADRMSGLTALLMRRDQFEVSDDFVRDIDTADWVTTLTDLGSASVGDAAGGVLALVPSDATVADNDEAYVESANEVFRFAAGKPLLFEARVQFTEAATNAANIIVGVIDAVGANSLLDNGGGPPASYSGAVFFKVDGATTWNVETSNSTTQTTTELTASNANNLAKRTVTAGGAAYQTLTLEFVPYSATAAYVTFSVDGLVVAQHDYVFTSATEMQVVLGVKNGSTNNEQLNVDYVSCSQSR